MLLQFSFVKPSINQICIVLVYRAGRIKARFNFSLPALAVIQ
jgi:hypothetical protein